MRGLEPPRRRRRAAPARHVLAVGSGKGGVGKSTVAVNLSLALASLGSRVGVLDADLHGPNIPLMLGIHNRQETRMWTLATNAAHRSGITIPAVDCWGLQVMSAGFILAEDQPMVLETTTVRMLAKQLMFDVAWAPDLEFLVVDLPPGTADVQQLLVEEMPLTGAIVVVTPQDVAHLDARKAVAMYSQAGVRVLGAVENMCATECPHCHRLIDVFPAVADDRSIYASGVRCLARIPLDPTVSAAGDEGTPIFLRDPGSAVVDALTGLAREVSLLARGQPYD